MRVGFEVDDRESGTTGRRGNVAAGHFDAISESTAKSKLCDRGRKRVAATHSDRHINSLAEALVPSENK